MIDTDFRNYIKVQKALQRQNVDALGHYSTRGNKITKKIFKHWFIFIGYFVLDGNFLNFQGVFRQEESSHSFTCGNCHVSTG